MSVFNLMQRRKFSFKQLQNSQLSLYPRPISFKFLCYTLSRHWNLLTANKNPGKQSMQTNKLVLAFEHTVSNEMKTCEIYEQSVQNLCVTNQRQWADISLADLRIANNHFECNRFERPPFKLKLYERLWKKSPQWYINWFGSFSVYSVWKQRNKRSFHHLIAKIFRNIQCSQLNNSNWSN